MGNWRTVNITGTIDERHIGPLRARLAYDYDTPGGFDNFGPLSFSPERPSLCGLGDWVRPVVNACGNLAERDYSVGDVAGELEKLVVIAPSMLLKVHCGGDWESGECVATISVGEGIVATGPPEVKMIAGPSEEQVMGNLLTNLMRG
jgi:hypothetical protein